MPAQNYSSQTQNKGSEQHAFISVCTFAPVFTEVLNVLCTAHLDMKYFRNMLTQTKYSFIASLIAASELPNHICTIKL